MNRTLKSLNQESTMMNQQRNIKNVGECEIVLGMA